MVVSLSLLIPCDFRKLASLASGDVSHGEYGSGYAGLHVTGKMIAKSALPILRMLSSASSYTCLKKELHVRM
jgi:hypothetical protein